MTTETFSVACAGAGYFAQFHHAAWQGTKGARLVAVADRDPGAAVPDGHALAPAGAWLNAAREPLGGRGGGKPTFAQGSAKGDDSGAVVAAARAFAQ